jgi:hypothetical protein
MICKQTEAQHYRKEVLKCRSSSAYFLHKYGSCTMPLPVPGFPSIFGPGNGRPCRRLATIA